MLCDWLVEPYRELERRELLCFAERNLLLFCTEYASHCGIESDMVLGGPVRKTEVFGEVC